MPNFISELIYVHFPVVIIPNRLFENFILFLSKSTNVLDVVKPIKAPIIIKINPDNQHYFLIHIFKIV
jgi:hypothetical protein